MNASMLRFSTNVIRRTGHSLYTSSVAKTADKEVCQIWYFYEKY